MRSDRNGHVAEWCFTDAFAIQPHLGPRQRIQRKGSLRPVQRHGRHLTRVDDHRARFAEAEHVADELEVMTSGGRRDSSPLVPIRRLFSNTCTFAGAATVIAPDAVTAGGVVTGAAAGGADNDRARGDVVPARTFTRSVALPKSFSTVTV
jgi:hypothetical protein